MDLPGSWSRGEAVVDHRGYGRCDDRCRGPDEFGEAARSVEPDVSGTVDSDRSDLLDCIVKSIAGGSG